jgi:hypothetical protein
MTFFTFYLICMAIAAVELAFMAWHGVRHDHEQIKLGEVLIAIGLLAIPIVNAFVMIAATWMLLETFGDFVLFDGEKK